MISTLSSTLIVMPAFNEEEAIGAVIGEVIETLPGVRVLVVDDGSSDSTAEVARRAGAHVAQLPFNLGVGGAMRLGFIRSLKAGRWRDVRRATMTLSRREATVNASSTGVLLR